MIKYTVTFPGQGSQSIGMMDNIAHAPIIKKTFIEASDILGKNFWSMVTTENKIINQKTGYLLLKGEYVSIDDKNDLDNARRIFKS